VSFQDHFNFYAPLDHIKSQGPPMSDYQQDAGKGAIYRNDKATKPSHPSHTGFCEIDGKRYRIAAWVRTKEGSDERYFSLSFRPAEDRTDDRRQQERREQQRPKDDQIPF
jgi:hypothetical protein